MNIRLIATFTILFFALPLFVSSIWVSQESGTVYALLDIDCVNENTCWVVGGPYIGSTGFPSSVLLKTTDAGENWVSITFPRQHQLSGVCFVNESTGWLIGENHVYKSIDSGQNWVEQNYRVNFIGNATPFLQAISCIDENTAYAVGLNGVIIKTEDGTTWQQKHGEFNGRDPALQGVYFVNARTGWAVGLAGTVIKTINSGETWVEQDASSTLAFWNVYFLNETYGWVSGSVRQISKTTNGNTWEPRTAGEFISSIRGIHFLNELNGWAVGNQEIIRTVDGGETWERQRVDNGSRILSVILREVEFSGSNGWAVGDEGVILKYSEPVSAIGEPVDPELECPAVTDDCEAGFTPEWIYDEGGACIVDYVCVEDEGTVCQQVSLELPDCELPEVATPSFNGETNCQEEYVCQVPLVVICQNNLDQCIVNADVEMRECLSRASTQDCWPPRQEAADECSEIYNACIAGESSVEVVETQPANETSSSEEASAPSNEPTQESNDVFRLVILPFQMLANWLTALFS